MTAEERTKTIEKIQKLLALASSPHEGEASLAMEKAGQILAAAGLTMEEVRTQKTEDSQVSVEKVTAKADRTGWLGALAFSVSLAFDCKSLRSKGKNTRSHVMVFIGLKKDVEMATHFFVYLKREIDSLASRFEADRGRGWRGLEVDAYRVGAVRTVGRRLREMFEAKTAATSDCTALVVLKGKKIDEKMQSLFPRITPSRSAKSTGSHGAFAAGRRDGENISLRRSVGGNGQRQIG